MTPGRHVILSTGSGVVLGMLTRSWMAGTACCLIGILVDVDHLFDFWLNRGFSLNPRKFFDFCYFGTARRFFDVFHGYEFIPILWMASSSLGDRALSWGLFVGYSLHLLADQFSNTHLNRWTYFFSYRMFHRFSSAKIVLRAPGNRPQGHG